MNTTVGHEITHVLEGTELYTEMQNALFEYSKSKGDFDARREALAKLYDEADIDSELTSDLVGDYLFTDEDFINNLSTKHRNVFEKIYDEVKYLLKLATAGSKEKRKLEALKHQFEKVWRENGSTSEGGDAKFSVSDKKSLDKNRENSYNLYTTTDDFIRQVPYGIRHDFARSLANKTSGMTEGETKTIYVSGYIFEADGYMHGRILAPYNSKTKELLGVAKNEHSRINKDTESASIWTEAIRNAERRSGGDSSVSRRGRSSADDRLLGESPERYPSGNNERVRQPLETKAERDAIIKQLREMYGLDANKSDGAFAETKSNDIAPTKVSSKDDAFFDDKKTKFSLSDSDGKTLTNEQNEYFKDSKMRDDNGNLKVMYHGSQDAGFHIFDSSMSDDDTSFFFVDRNDVAASYSGTTETYEAQTIRSAEDMNKFISIRHIIFSSRI